MFKMACSSFLSVILLLSSVFADRTVIMIHKKTVAGQELFVRGGIGHNNRPGCFKDAKTDICAIPIYHKYLGTTKDYSAYNAWKVGDEYLDWHGGEMGQGNFEGITAEGTPLKWSSSDPYNPNFQVLNKYGDNYWMVDLEMDCSATEDGWFETKAFIYGHGGGWEADISQDLVCTGDVGGISGPTGDNHGGRCGFVNIFYFGSSSCVINNF